MTKRSAAIESNRQDLSCSFIFLAANSAKAILTLCRRAVLNSALPGRFASNIDASMQQERIIAALTASFGMLALVLACVGVCGVMAYSVAQRTSEIGIRMALGARPRQVLTMVLREGTWISAAGVAGGIGASIFAARLVQSLLYGLKANDLVVFAVAAFALGVGGTRGKLDSRSSCGCRGTNAGSSTGVSFNYRKTDRCTHRRWFVAAIIRPDVDSYRNTLFAIAILTRSRASDLGRHADCIRGAQPKSMQLHTVASGALQINTMTSEDLSDLGERIGDLARNQRIAHQIEGGQRSAKLFSCGQDLCEIGHPAGGAIRRRSRDPAAKVLSRQPEEDSTH